MAARPNFYAVDTDGTHVETRASVGRRHQTHEASSDTRRAGSKGSGLFAKSEQVLQLMQGATGHGAAGVAVAVGTKEVIELAGPQARIFSKSSGQLLATRNTTKFFGVPSGYKMGQTSIVYDPVGKRFVAVGATQHSGDHGLVIRISKSSTGGSFGPKRWLPSATFAFGDSFNEDFPRIGTSDNKIAITAKTDDLSTPNRIFFFPKQSYFKGKNPGAWAADLDVKYNGQAPAVNQSSQSHAFVAIPDSGDVTVTTYAGTAGPKGSGPVFSKNVMYPKTGLTTPPAVPTTGDTLDLGALNFSGVAWRSNRLWAATTVDCAGKACVRLFGINTGNGVSLATDETLKNVNRDWFSPAIAFDKGGNIHVTATDVGGQPTSPSQVVWVRKGKNNWTRGRYIVKGNAPVTAPPGGPTATWGMANAAAADPTSPWDVWIAGTCGAASVAKTHQTTYVARVSLAKNQARLIVGKGTGSGKAQRGHTYAFTVQLTRPGGDPIKGLPVGLANKRPGHGKWNYLRSGHTASNGKVTWRLRIRHDALLRAVGKAVHKGARQGIGFENVNGRTTRVHAQ